MRFPSQNLLIIYTQLLYCEHTRECKMYPVTVLYPVKKDNKTIAIIKENAGNKFLIEPPFCKGYHTCAVFCCIGVWQGLEDLHLSTYNNRGVFKTLPNIWDVAFCESKTIFAKRSSLNAWQGFQYASDNI